MDRTICAEVKLAERSRLRQLLGSGRSGTGSTAMGSAAVPARADVGAERHDSETDFDAPDVDPELSGTLWGWPDTKWPLGRTRPRPSKSLARLWLCHVRRSADADPRSLDVAGRDPPLGRASIGIGEDGAGQPHPPRRCGGLSQPAVLAGSPSVEPRAEVPGPVGQRRGHGTIGCRPTARRRVPCQTRGSSISRLTSEPRQSVQNRRPYRAVDVRFGANLLRAYGRLYISSAPSGSFAE